MLHRETLWGPPWFHGEMFRFCREQFGDQYGNVWEPIQVLYRGVQELHPPGSIDRFLQCFTVDSICVKMLHFKVVNPLPSSRHHLSNDAGLEDKRENCQNCSVLCYVQQLCIMICTRMSTN